MEGEAGTFDWCGKMTREGWRRNVEGSDGCNKKRNSGKSLRRECMGRKLDTECRKGQCVKFKGRPVQGK